MNVYTCVDHDGHYPVGVASVVVAATEEEATAVLAAALDKHGLVGSRPFTLRRINISEPRAFILQDGDY